MCCLPSFFLKGRAKGRVRSAKPDRSLRREARALVVCGVCGAMRSQAQPAVGTTAETQSGSRVIQVPECTRDVHVVRALVSVWPSGVREKADRIVMRSLFSLLVVVARPYTYTHMVTESEAVSDPSKRRLYGLFEVAAGGRAPQTAGCQRLTLLNPICWKGVLLIVPDDQLHDWCQVMARPPSVRLFTIANPADLVLPGLAFDACILVSNFGQSPSNNALDRPNACCCGRLPWYHPLRCIDGAFVKG